MQSKAISPKVYVDSYDLDLWNSRITAQVVINDAEQATEFSINQEEFEKFCDDNDLREFEKNIPGNEGVPERDVLCILTWEEIYDDHKAIYKLLKEYIEHLYIMEATDKLLEPLKQILSSHKAAI